MSTGLVIDPELHRRLRTHLLPDDSAAEQAAFLFAKTAYKRADFRFKVIDHTLVAPDGVEYNSVGYLELTDQTRAQVIKKAHDLEASLVELHSHRLPFPAVFSPTDIDGLRQFVPHVWWRLRGRPYLALVIAPTSFDALLCVTNARDAQPLDRLVFGRRVLRPTGPSLKHWSHNDGSV